MCVCADERKNKRNLNTIRAHCKRLLHRAEEIKRVHAADHSNASSRSATATPAAQADSSPMYAQLEELIVREKPDVKWDDVIGMEDAKQAMEEAIVLSIRYPHLFTEERRPPSGILLFGPPGTGKTMLAKACASMTDSTFFSVSSASLVSKYQGESEKLVRELFRMARDCRPSVVFIDEIDALGSKRGDDDTTGVKRLKNELLVQLQKADDEGGIMVLGATNTPFALDPAMRRRFHRRIYIPLPDVRAREAIITAHIGSDIDTGITTRDIRRFAAQTDGYSAADLAIMVRDALMTPVRHAMRSTHFKQDQNGSIVPCDARDPNAQAMRMWDMQHPELLKVGPVMCKDFESSLSRIKPSVSTCDIEEHIRFASQYGEGLCVAPEAKVQSIELPRKSAAHRMRNYQSNPTSTNRSTIVTRGSNKRQRLVDDDNDDKHSKRPRKTRMSSSSSSS